MNQLFRALSAAEAAEFLALGLVAIVRWRQRGGATRGWLAATFGALGLFLILSHFFPPGSSVAPSWVAKPTLALIVFFPYLLYRFMRSLDGSPRWLNRAAAVVTGVLLAMTVDLPRFPAAGQPLPPYLDAYHYLFVVQWVLLIGAVAIRLWRAGKGQPTLARRRMRTLSLGSAALVILATVGASSSSNPSKASVFSILLALTGVCAAPLFLAGFAPPHSLIRIWRRREDEALQAASAELMVATDEAQVLSGLLPHVASIVGARTAAVYDASGGLLGAHGEPPPGVPAMARAPLREAQAGTKERVELRLPCGKLVVWASPYTPYFGRDELELLRSLGVMASLALERCRLFRRERNSMEALEEAQRIARLGSWRWVMATNEIEWSNELYRIHDVDPATFRPSVAGLQSFCHPDDRESRAATIQRAFEARSTFEAGYRIVLADGQVRSLQGLGKVLCDETGAPIEMIGTVQDVTEQRRLQTMRSEFISNAAHELRTPLTTLTGMAMLLATNRHTLPEAVADQAFDALGRQGERARVLINNLLDLSQLDAGRVPVHMEVVALAEVASRASEAVARPQGAQVEINVPDCLSALGDSDRLEQVVTNLLSNAYRYGGPRVRIEGSRADGRVLLVVSDDGPGVPVELVETMFEPFTRGKSVTGTVGSGLGLAICRRLVEACQGTLRYEGQEPHGSRFVVELEAAA